MTRGIDHLVLCVNDLKKARTRYEALGFTMTPQAQHPFGTGNIIAQLDGCFLEILSVTRPNDIPVMPDTSFNFAKFNQDFLAMREGFSMLVLDSSDEQTDRADFLKKSLHVYDPFEFQRQAVQPNGDVATVGFSLTFLDDPAALPGMAFFTCKQWRPDLFWKPDYQTHANGANTISTGYVVAPDPKSAADFLSAFAGAEITESDQQLSVETARGTLVAMTAKRFDAKFPDHGLTFTDQPMFAGFGIGVADLSKTQELLAAADLKPITASDGLYIRADSGLGCLIEFTA